MVGGELRIDRYVVEAKLGEGGMADVWLCRLAGARGFTKRVVIKTIKAACRNDHYESMFIDEANIGARLEHPNIPRVTELGQTASGVLYLVQEYVDGPSVQQIIGAQRAIGRCDLRLAVKIASSVASALDFAYRLGDDQGRPLDVVHRDVSTSNILVSRRGPAKLIDFGVARFSDRETETQTGILKGKLRFMAPEVVSGGPTSHQSDLYSLGQVLYRLCTTQRPGGLVGSADFAMPSEIQPDVDPALDSIILACLQVKPDHRIVNGELLSQRLDRWALAHGGPVTAAESAARLASMFPGGATDWQPTDTEPLSASMASATPSARPRSRPGKGRVSRSVVFVASVGAGLLLAGLGFAAFLATQPDRAAVAHSTPADAALKNLIESATQALMADRYSDAEALWRESMRLKTSDVELQMRRAQLTADLQLYGQIEGVRALAGLDPEKARTQAEQLHHDHPEHPDVAALLDELSP